MVLNIVFLSVVLRKSDIQQRWPDGLEGFNKQYPDCAHDESLVLSAYMSYGEAKGFVYELKVAGFSNNEIAVVDQFHGWQQEVDWLELYESAGRLCCRGIAELTDAK